eukprot:8567176-Pyramimonas_sp.AAC.1
MVREITTMKEREGSVRVSTIMMGLIMVLVVISISTTISHILDIHPTATSLGTNSTVLDLALHRIVDAPNEGRGKETQPGQMYDQENLYGHSHFEHSEQSTGESPIDRADARPLQTTLTTPQRTHDQKAHDRQVRRQYEENHGHVSPTIDTTEPKQTISGPHREQQGVETSEGVQYLATSMPKPLGFKPTSVTNQGTAVASDL